MAINIIVECSPGSEISKAFHEAIRLATKLEIIVEFTFNGVTCLAYPNGNADEGVKAFHEAIQSKVQYKYASARQAQ